MPCVRNEKTLKKCTKDSTENLKSLTDIIKNYQETCSEEAYEAKRAINPNDKDLCRFMYYDLNGVLEMKDQGIKEIISRCICNRNRHQYCISNEAVNTATEKLMDAKSLYPYSSHINKDFEFLYDKLKGIIGTVKGIETAHFMMPASVWAGATLPKSNRNTMSTFTESSLKVRKQYLAINSAG